VVSGTANDEMRVCMRPARLARPGQNASVSHPFSYTSHRHAHTQCAERGGQSRVGIRTHPLPPSCTTAAGTCSLSLSSTTTRKDEQTREEDSPTPPFKEEKQTPGCTRTQRERGGHSVPSPSPHRVLARPLPGGLLVPGPVRLVDVGDLRDERVVRVRVAQQGADGEEDFGQSQGRRPLLLQDVQADGALRVDVGVVDLKRARERERRRDEESVE